MRPGVHHRRSTMSDVHRARARGRGAGSNPGNRYERRAVVPVDPSDSTATEAAWCTWADGLDDPQSAPLPTTVTVDSTRTILAKNDSPDVPFDISINPYRGCEHGCIYCYARPSHSYLGLSPGLDFETKLTAKPDAARVLAAELSRPGYRPAVLAIGRDGTLVRSTEPYQRTVAGVYSTKPGFLGNDGSEDQSNRVPLAVVGIVPVKASARGGEILPGDLLVASDLPGHVMKAGLTPPVGTVLGKALEGLEAGTGKIRMLAMLQ